MRWLLRLVLLRVLGSRVLLALAVLAWFRSALRGGRASSAVADATAGAVRRT